MLRRTTLSKFQRSSTIDDLVRSTVERAVTRTTEMADARERCRCLIKVLVAIQEVLPPRSLSEDIDRNGHLSSVAIVGYTLSVRLRTTTAAAVPRRHNKETTTIPVVQEESSWCRRRQ